MIQYTDIMINNTNKKENTMTIKNKKSITTNPNQIAGAYFLWDFKFKGYKIGICRKGKDTYKRIRGLRQNYGYGRHLQTLKIVTGTYADISNFENFLKKKYKAQNVVREFPGVMHKAADGSTYFVKDALAVNGKTEWLVLDNNLYNEVLSDFTNFTKGKRAA